MDEGHSERSGNGESGRNVRGTIWLERHSDAVLCVRVGRQSWVVSSFGWCTKTRLYATGIIPIGQVWQPVIVLCWQIILIDNFKFRSNIIQQRNSSIFSIAGILNVYNQGFYDAVLELPLSKMFFLLRFAFDDNIQSSIEVTSKALATLFYNDCDEVSNCRWWPIYKLSSRIQYGLFFAVSSRLHLWLFKRLSWAIA